MNFSAFQERLYESKNDIVHLYCIFIVIKSMLHYRMRAHLIFLCLRFTLYIIYVRLNW